MMFKMLATQGIKHSIYINEIFGIISYFIWELLDIRPQSVQEKFMWFFQNHSLSQNFLRQCYEYIEVHKDKLSSNVLHDFYRNKHFKDELSHKWYIIDKNLEKQVVSLLKSLWWEENKEMKDYMRIQENNIKSFNFVALLTNYSKEFQNHLHYPVAFDTFASWIDTLLEFVQGPNYKNLNILIQEKIVEMWNNILMLEYRNTEENKLLQGKQFLNNIIYKILSKY